MLNLRGRVASEEAAASRLYDWAVARSRRPLLYAALGAPDTVEGRFELLTAHVILIINRLTGLGGAAGVVRQTLFDRYIRNLDGALREMGVGDLAVGKRMKNLGAVFYGRAQAYDNAFKASDEVELKALVERTILHGVGGGDSAGLAAELLRQRAELAGLSDDRVAQGNVA